MKRLIQDSTKKQTGRNVSRAYLFFSLSPPFSLFFSVGVWRRGLEGKERAGSRPPAFPRAPLGKGEGFLPRQPSVTFCEQQEPGLLQSVSPGEDSVCIQRGVSPLISCILSASDLSFYLLQVSNGARFSGVAYINKIASQRCQNNAVGDTGLTSTKIPRLPPGMCWQQAGNVIISANVTLWNTFWDQWTCVWCSLMLLLSRLESIRAGFFGKWCHLKLILWKLFLCL